LDGLVAHSDDDSAQHLSENTQTARADALDVLIEQERQLIAHYEARQANADGMAAAAVTAVLALAALTATAAKTIEHVDATFAWLLVGALVLVCVAALIVRSAAGLSHTPTSVLSTGSEDFDKALTQLRANDLANRNPIEVRERSLTLWRARANDAHEAATSKARWAAFASAALALAVALTGVFALLTGANA
jgi:hypothetical protein